MSDFILALVATLVGGGIGAVAVHRFGVKPVRDTLDATKNLNDTLRQALAECQTAFREKERDMEACNSAREQAIQSLTTCTDRGVELTANLATCTARRDELLEQLDAMGQSHRDGKGLVERYYFALTGAAGIGDPKAHLVALFAHFGHEYTPPAEPVPDTPEPGPTEGP